MVPLIKRSSDVLIEKMGEFAESGKAVELFKYVYDYIYTCMLESEPMVEMRSLTTTFLQTSTLPTCCPHLHVVSNP